MIGFHPGRWLALTTLMGGLLVTTVAPASLAAGAVRTRPTVTIHATGPVAPVTGYVFTYYGTTKYDTARVWGSVDNAQLGSRIELFGQGFHEVTIQVS